jgi:hypothetical protein
VAGPIRNVAAGAALSLNFKIETTIISELGFFKPLKPSSGCAQRFMRYRTCIMSAGKGGNKKIVNADELTRALRSAN